MSGGNVFTVDPDPATSGRHVGRLLLTCLAAGVVLAGILLPVIGGMALGVQAGVREFNTLPSDLAIPAPAERSTIYAADGSVLATVYFEDRVPVRLTQIAPVMRKAIVAIEDSRFYATGAIDLRGTMRALVTDLGAGGARQGGSTLTQQYVKNVLVERARLDAASRKQSQAAARAATKDTLGRKLREARYAVALEKRFTKDEILRRYLNLVYFGDGVYGVYTAAKHYFSVAPWQLSLPQAALLAGLVRDPGQYDPRLHPKAARARRDTVLDRMAQLHMITPAQAGQAKQSPLGLTIHPQPNGCQGSRAPFFCDYVLRRLERLPALGQTSAQRARAVLRGGLQIHTTLLPPMQSAATHALRSHVDAGGPYAGAEAVVEPGTGKVQALAVSRPYGSGTGQTRLDLAVDAKDGGSHGFHSGSTFKVFTLAAALDQGLSPSFTMHAPPVLHNPSGFRTCNGAVLDYGGHDVHNAVASDAGTWTLRQATERSINTFFIKLETKTGLCGPVHMARAAGMHQGDGSPIEQYPSFSLGVFDVSPLTLADGYATFASGGTYCSPVAITAVVDRTGRHLHVPGSRCRQTVKPAVAHAVSDVLKGVIAHGTGTAAQIGRPAAGKTGTVGSFTAAWFCGYVPQSAGCVWFGYPDGAHGRSLTDVTVHGRRYHHVYGASIPAPIWGATMAAGLQGVPPRPLP